jgi:serine/threonine protein kinase
MKCDTSKVKSIMKAKGKTPHCIDLVCWMLEVDAEDRPTAKEALKHKWFIKDKQVIKDLLDINVFLCYQSPIKRSKTATNGRIKSS